MTKKDDSCQKRREKIVSLYSEGVEISAIAKMFAMDYISVYKIVYALKARQPSNARKFNRLNAFARIDEQLVGKKLPHKPSFSYIMRIGNVTLTHAKAWIAQQENHHWGEFNQDTAKQNDP